ncbi:hypothetical protein HanXRQr2_Chr05g0232121 [Helianthus annuus]|uniref:Uncharacterized protein n=1 Tax=Helianthus annuus TaxID=4232 RepID=A0A9K3NNW7_HELAN|nr:hypothetical protein HanXRQr2_Chr05g0232121 [Helianthus annuus]
MLIGVSKKVNPVKNIPGSATDNKLYQNRSSSVSRCVLNKYVVSFFFFFLDFALSTKNRLCLNKSWSLVLMVKLNLLRSIYSLKR